jgi:uncharacterized protein (DUF433 family)
MAKNKKRSKFTGKYDPREVPSYGIPEAAQYLRMPVTTLRAWVLGQRYVSKGAIRVFRSIIHLPGKKERLLSFSNLVEAHILNSIRRDFGVQLQNARKAIHYLKREFNSERPLLDRSFETDGIDLFVSEYGKLINVTQAGQTAMRPVIASYLKRIERGGDGLPVRLFPFTRGRDMGEPKSVVIDPCVSYGRPVIAGTGIPTSIIAERCKAGESIEALAEDYRRDAGEILEAIRCELQVEAA